MREAPSEGAGADAACQQAHIDTDGVNAPPREPGLVAGPPATDDRSHGRTELRQSVVTPDPAIHDKHVHP